MGYSVHGYRSNLCFGMFGVCLKMRSSKGRFHGNKDNLMELENKVMPVMLMLGGFSTGYESRFCHSSGPVDPGS
jgi:hypothetical protein